MEIKRYLNKRVRIGDMENGYIGHCVPWALTCDNVGCNNYLSESAGVSDYHIGGTTTTMVVVRIDGKFFVDISGCRKDAVNDTYPELFYNGISIKRNAHSIDDVPVEKIFRDEKEFISFLRSQ